MSDPKDETWRVGRKTGKVIYRGEGDDDLIGMMWTREAAALAACAPDMLRMLKRLRLGAGDVPECPRCDRPPALGCARDCDLDGVIRKAEGR